MRVPAPRQPASEPIVLGHRAAAGRIDASVRRQLQAELESVLAFADYCQFLGQERLGARAGELARVAQTLYEETLACLQARNGPDGARPWVPDRVGLEGHEE
jgi:hypothetical protein